MERAYYVVRPGQLLDVLVAKDEAISRQRSEIFKALRQASLATGCSAKTCLIDRNACVGLVFDRGKPPSYLCSWKRVGPDTWWPRSRTKVGKTIAGVFSFAQPTDLEDVLPPDVECCMKVGDKFFIMGSYDEMRADEPMLPDVVSVHLERIKPSAFQRLLDEHNAEEKDERCS